MLRRTKRVPRNTMLPQGSPIRRRRCRLGLESPHDAVIADECEAGNIQQFGQFLKYVELVVCRVLYAQRRRQ